MEIKEPNLEARLGVFRGEIRSLVEAEKREEKTAHFISLAEFDPDELTIEDMDVWEKVKNKSIDWKDLSKHGETIDLVEGEIKKGLRPGVSPSRVTFRAFINNAATSILAEREMDAFDHK